MATLRIERDPIRIESISAMKPDPKWHYADKSGHEHRFGEKDSLPTLALVTEEPYWCSDCRDEHQDYHFECMFCGEHVEPGYVPDPGPHYIYGPTRYYLDDRPITEEEAKDFIAGNA